MKNLPSCIYVVIILIICVLILCYFTYQTNLVVDIKNKLLDENTHIAKGTLFENDITKELKSSDGHTVIPQSWLIDEEQERFLIPNDAVLQTKSKNDLLVLYARYTSSFQVLCQNHERLGTVFDGGKEHCMDKSVRPGKKCVVYSFGSNNNFDFEQDVIKMYGCKVYTFDPSMSGVQHVNVPKGCQFVPVGIGHENIVNDKKWVLKTFDAILAEFNDSGNNIDILKMDVEEAEWQALDQMMLNGCLKNVRQLMVEFHFSEDVNKQRSQLAVLRRLFNFGFRIFSRERNTTCKECSIIITLPDGPKQISKLVEITFINLRYLKTNEVVRNS